MKTITIIVGNSDNKLTQVDWTRFCRDIRYIIEKDNKIEFSAPSIGWLAYQNACWVFTLRDGVDVNVLKSELTDIRKRYLQDSLAWILGETEFI